MGNRLIDLTGQRFGRLSVISQAESKHTPSGTYAMWNCVCDCGKEVCVRSKSLRKGKTVSCGCYNRETCSERSLEDLSGKKFGSLYVVDRATDLISPSGAHRTRWNCKCECGNVCIKDSYYLKTSPIPSCGCMFATVTSERSKTHGHSKDRLYKVWSAMRQRCNCMTNKDYALYGGRGISVCPEWDDYACFRGWAYSHGYDENAEKGKCTLDRIDVDGNYCPENCRWVDMTVQCNNKTNSNKYEMCGVSKTLRDWSNEYGAKYQLVRSRVETYGWSLIDALTLPLFTKRGGTIGKETYV